MRKPPSSDTGRATRPAPDPPAPADSAAPVPEAAAPPDPPADASGPPSLIWPPAEDELRDWEVLHLHSTGQTVIEPMKYVPPALAKTGEVRSGERPIPSAPAPYMPPHPIDDPVGEASLRPLSSDLDLPETELIEPLSVTQAPTHPALPTGAYAPVSGSHAAAVPPVEASPDDRTVVIPRTPFGAPRLEPRHEPADDTNPGAGATRILVAPNFAATVGHAPTVPVSALHRSAVQPPKPEAPRNPLEETLPAGVARERLFAPAAPPVSDDTASIKPSQADTHPVPIAVPKAPAAAGPAGPPSPFSRVASRGPQPVVAPAAPEPVAAPLGLVPPAAPAPGPASAKIASFGAPVPTRPAAASPAARLVVLALGVVVAAAVALGAYWYFSERFAVAAPLAPATLSVDSSPAGAAVSIDGSPRGRTPLRVELTEGAHTLDVTHGGTTKHIPLTLAAGTVTAHSLEFAAPAAVTADAAIEIRSDPAGARVVVDGAARGTTPIVVTGLTSGKHEVQLSGPFRTVTRTVTLAPKQQQLLVVAPARSAASDTERPSRTPSDTGYVAIQSPIVLRIVRNGDFVGTSEDARLALPAGEHVIGLENESVGYRDVRTVQIAAGKVTTVPVSLPNGAISINARPWAEVFVDGQRIGETPVSQHALPVGIHEVVFRHPEFGERTVSVVVKLGTTGRAFTDFTK
jgi:hypothetical protein